MSNQGSLLERFKLLVGLSGKSQQQVGDDRFGRKPRRAPAARPLEVLVIDVSGSMSEEDYKPTRLDGAKDAACSFVKKLNAVSPESYLAVASFSSDAKMACEPLPVESELARIESAIKRLNAEGFTNMSSGLRLAGKAIGSFQNARLPRVLLLTDGHSNRGGDPEPVAEKLKEHGVQLDIIGIGGSPSEVNGEQLKRMASVVNGELRYWFIENVPMLVKKFEGLALRKLK